MAQLTNYQIEQLCDTIKGGIRTRTDELALLYNLCFQAPKSGWFVELGSYQGRSSIALCQAARELKRDNWVMLIDNFSEDASISAYKLNFNLGRLNYWPLIVDGDSRQVPKQILPGQKVALLFVDSQHTAAQFEAEMDAWQPLLAKGAIVVCHDYDSPTWTEMNGVIDKRLGHLKQIGRLRRLIAFRWS
jgi:predicted O-methyltransferase YrrM